MTDSYSTFSTTCSTVDQSNLASRRASRRYESFSSKDFQDPIEEVVIHNTVQPR